FRRGDAWVEDTALHIYVPDVTVDDYGNSSLAIPKFSRFSRRYGKGWEHVQGNLYERDEPIEVGWIRESSDGYRHIYYRAASARDAMAHPYSWFYDKTGLDPLNFDHRPKLFVNANAPLDTLAVKLEACPADGVGWVAGGDNVRLQNLRL